MPLNEHWDRMRVHPPAIIPLPTQFALRLREISDRRVIPRSVQHGEFRAVTDYAMDSLIVSLSTYCASDHMTGADVTRHLSFDFETTEWESWWQHTKHTLFPRLSRLLRRPARERTVVHLEDRTVHIHHDRYAMYPDAPIYPLPPDQFGRPIIVESWGEPTVSTDR